MAKFKPNDQARVIEHPALLNRLVGQEVEIIQPASSEILFTALIIKGWATKENVWEVKILTGPIQGKVKILPESALEPISKPDVGSWDEIQKSLGWQRGKELNNV